MLVVRNEQGEVLLEQRPSSGIWGGLWSLPECSEDERIEDWCHRNLYADSELDEMWPEFRHGFSHYHLHITPILLSLKGPPQGVMEALGRVWYNPRSPDERGLAAPVRKILESLAKAS
jgi:A/G-specific adenine glycosylase